MSDKLLTLTKELGDSKVVANFKQPSKLTYRAVVDVIAIDPFEAYEQLFNGTVVEEELKEQYDIKVLFYGDLRKEFLNFYEVDINQLADLVRSSYTSVVSEDILGKAVESFASALQSAAEKLIASNPADVLATQISQIMEIPKAPDEEPEE